MSWAEVKKINSDLSIPLDELVKNEIKDINSHTTAEIADIKDEISSITEQIDSVSTITKRGSVKSVQRGTSTATSKETNITINSVNLNKSVLITNSTGFCKSSDGLHALITCAYLSSSTNIKMMTSSLGGMTDSSGFMFAWQVIEFY